MRLLSRLDRRRRLIVAMAGPFAVAGVLLAVFAPGRPTAIPQPPNIVGDAPQFQYVRSLPDAGDPPLSRPVGVSVSGRRAFVSDSGDGVVRIFSTSGISLAELGRGVLRVPSAAVSDDTSDTVLVVDRGLHAVLRFAASGELLGEVRPSSEPTAAWDPLSIASDGEGLFAVADSAGRHRVIMLDREGDTAFSLGQIDATGTPGNVRVSLDYPSGVAFSRQAIWVSDGNNRRILIFDRDGAFQKFVRLEGVARGLTFLSDAKSGRVFVAAVDTLASAVVLLDEQGVAAGGFGAPGTSAAQMAYPNDVAYDPVTSQLFVADTGNARVQVWKVHWPSPAEQAPSPAGPGLAAIQVFGIGLASLAMIVLFAALWPRRL
jgi:DNA-binding beta-propeller fold protein YncE